MKTLLKFSSVVRRINYWLTMTNGVCFILGVLTLGVTADVVMRYALNAPLTGVKQIGEYALVWLCFLSVGWVLTNKQHVAITLLETWIFSKTKSRKKILDLSIDIVCLFYALPLLSLSVKEVWGECWGGIVLTGELGGAPAYLAHSCIPLGFLSLSVVLVLNTLTSILGIEERESALAKERKALEPDYRQFYVRCEKE